MAGIHGRRFGARVWVAVLAVSALALASATKAHALGELDYQGCWANAGANGCQDPVNDALASAAAVAASPDGRSVYAVSGTDGVSAFVRNADGSLTYQGCVAATNANGCFVPAGITGNPFIGASGIAVSPDGRSVYVASNVADSVSHFTRDTSGGSTHGFLGFQACIAATNANGCVVPMNPGFTGNPFDGANGIAVSPDNKSVYLASLNANSVSHFTRDTSGGPSHGFFFYQGCVAATAANGCAVPVGIVGDPFDSAQGVAVSPDNKSVYLASFLANSVSHFTRDTSGGPTHGFIGFQACIAATVADGCVVPAGITGNPFDGAHRVAVSPDNKSIYLASQNSDSVSHFTRDTSGGPTHGFFFYQGCVAATAANGCAVPAGITNNPFDAASGIAVSPDDKSVYLASFLNGGTVSHFTRDTSGGSTHGFLGFQACIASTATNGCAVPAGLVGNPFGGAFEIAASSDNKSVYLAATLANSVSSFTRAMPVPPPQLPPPPGPTGQRAAALKKCKKKFKKSHNKAAFKRCKKKANLLPV